MKKSKRANPNRDSDFDDSEGASITTMKIPDVPTKPKERRANYDSDFEDEGGESINKKSKKGKKSKKSKKSKTDNPNHDSDFEDEECTASKTKVYNVHVFYGGYFVHRPYVQYAGCGKKEIPNVELEKLTVAEVQELVRENIGEHMGDFDCLFYYHEGVKLFDEKGKDEVVRVLKYNGSVGLYVYHQPPAEENVVGENDGGVGTSKMGKKGGRKKSVAKKKVREELVKKVRECDDSSDEDSGGNGSCSDEEFRDIRRMRDEVRKQQKALEEEESERIRNRVRAGGGGMNEGSCSSGSFNSRMGEDTESDEEFAYAEPPTVLNKKKNVNEVFNPNTAGIDIKWNPGLIFGSKVEFKAAVRDYSIATGRPLRYIVDDQQRIQLACAVGCPFRLWISKVEEFEGWQIKTVNDDHNCIYHFANKLVSAKYLAGLYGAKIRRNPNWKLSEMKDEFKNVLKVEVNDSYSHCLEVIRGEPFWEDVEGDTILPPPVVKKLRGRPKKLRRREGWEGRVSKCKYVRLSKVGRKVHCTYCKEEGHNITKCPSKPEGYEPPQNQKKRGRKRKNVTEEGAELEARTMEVETGEAELMEEALTTTMPTQPTPLVVPSPNRRSVRLSQQKQTANGNETEVRSYGQSKSIFMPTPGLETNLGTGGTPPASTPPVRTRSSQQSTTTTQSRLVQSSSRKGTFKAPRKKN